MDTDNDGDMDLVIVRKEGDLKFYYENTGNATHAYTRREVSSTCLMGSPRGLQCPRVCGYGHDGDMDLVIGRVEGDLNYVYDSTECRLVATIKAMQSQQVCVQFGHVRGSKLQPLCARLRRVKVSAPGIWSASSPDLRCVHTRVLER